MKPKRQLPAGEKIPRLLTLDEIESLRQDNHRRHKANVEMLKTMDLSRLMPDNEKPAG
ncbi:hypothetical protein [Zobellella iuensis]|uniref:Uncharacterized protein n=1 Tax=Zobellella iuensis TaxID=2803811 RepID=A0ABS1QWG5_9GAMM|nr:hypothetical protein [Zobellella iuensis]MBL1379189.1 hypothetical protein [Zobellella iuensis]